jgi:hypothetical protein
MEYNVTFDSLPKNLEEMKAFPEADLKKPEGVAALTVAALCVYPADKEECFKMLDFLRGPRPLSNMEKQFIRDRFMDGRDYIPRSYFTGATPDNGYQPNTPYTVWMKDSAAPIYEDGYKIMDLKSGGADSTRTITLRNKPSTGEWFLWEQMLLAQIRIPTAQDPWA